MLSRLNFEILSELYKNRLNLFELPLKPSTRAKQFIGLFYGHIDGLNHQTIINALNIIKEKNITHVFIDGSNLGVMARAIHYHYPSVEIITFFHNVETCFFWGLLRSNKTLHAFTVFLVNYLSEKQSVRYSHKRICLSHRDSSMLNKIFSRGATHIAPMCVTDQLPDGFESSSESLSKGFALFVGGNFYANRIGIQWFVKHVVPHIDIKVCIVGKGLEKHRKDLDVPGKVTVIGAVDSLTEWYQNAQFVIAPIFDGSGMKTKIAEALMYGKKVVGTPEAFSGYEGIADQVGWLCRTVQEFVDAISIAQHETTVEFDPVLRDIYERDYSFGTAKWRLEKIISSSVSKEIQLCE